MAEATGEFFYTEHTENPLVVEDLSKKIKPTPKTIVSVCGAGWPVRFQDLFPDAQVFSFDANKEQIAEFREQVHSETGHYPKLLSLESDQFGDFVDGIRDSTGGVDLLYISNIPDYLTRDDLQDLVELIGDCEIKGIIFSALEEYERPGADGNSEVLADILEDIGYEVLRIKNNDFEVKNYFLASLSD